jgi:hypothetical protein
MRDGKRLSPYAIRSQTPVVGWLHYEADDDGAHDMKKVRARLVSESGVDLLLPRERACLVACHGRRGALIEGVQYRRKGTKHSITDRQAWWCEAPPRARPLLDQEARILAAEREYAARKIAGWGDV